MTDNPAMQSERGKELSATLAGANFFDNRVESAATHIFSFAKALEDVQKEMNRNLNECLYGPRVERHITFLQRFCAFISEIKNRVSNAYDCLVKGVDPYDGY